MLNHEGHAVSPYELPYRTFADLHSIVWWVALRETFFADLT